MNDIFRLKIVSKRQITIPQILMMKLHLAEGDELEIEVRDDTIVAVRPLKLVPTQLFTSDMLQKLQRRAEKMASGIVAKPPTNLVRTPEPLGEPAAARRDVGEEEAQAEGQTATNAY